MPTSPSFSTATTPIRSTSRVKTLSATRLDARATLNSLDPVLADQFKVIVTRGAELQDVLRLQDYPSNLVSLILSDRPPRLHPAIALAATNLAAATSSIKLHLVRAHREASAEAFARLASDISSVMLRFAEAGILDEQRGVSLTLDTLIPYILPRIIDDTASIKFASCLRIIITSQSSKTNQGELLCLTVAARALGRLVHASDLASRADFTKFEAERALEWLELPVHKSKRLAACLILRHLCDSEAVLVISKDHILYFFEHVEASLQDSNADTRFAACDALHAFLNLIDNGDEVERCFRRCYTIVHKGIEKVGTPASIHGSLLTIGELIRRRNPLIQPVFADLCFEILRLRTHADPKVQQQVAAVIADLSNYSRAFYTSPHMKVALEYLLACCRAPGPTLFLAKTAFASLCGLVQAVPHFAIQPDLERLVDIIREALHNKDLAPSALECVSAIASKPELAVELSQLRNRRFLGFLDDVFACTLSPELVQAVKALSAALEPGWKALLAARLVHSVALCITGQPFDLSDAAEDDSGCDASDIGPLLAALKPDPLSSPPPSDPSPGLDALCVFSFGSINLVHFLHRHVRKLLDAPLASLRIKAATTCATVLIASSGHRGRKVREMAARIVEDLLARALVDSSEDVRERVMLLLNQPVYFGVYLAQLRQLKQISLALHDQCFAVSRAATILAVSLSSLSPVYVLPALRKTAIGWIGDLRAKTTSAGAKEEIALVLSDLVSGLSVSPGLSCRSLVMPLIGPLMMTLIQEIEKSASDAHSRAETDTALLRAIGACGFLDDPHARWWMREAIDAVISTILDTRNPKRCEAGVEALCRLLRGAGSLIRDAVAEHPHLVDTLLEIINEGTLYPWSLQSQAMRLLGFIGAIDPLVIRSKYARNAEPQSSGAFDMTIKAVVGGRRRRRPKKDDERPLLYDQVDSPHVPDKFTNDAEDEGSSVHSGYSFESNEDANQAEFGSSSQEQLEAYIRTVAIATLTRILKTQSLSAFHGHVVEAAGNTCRSLGMNILPFLPELVPAILSVGFSPRSESELVRLCVKQLTVFVSVLRRHMRPYLDRVFALVLRQWDLHIFEGLALLQEAAVSLKEEFVVHLPWVIPRLVLALRPSPGPPSERDEKVCLAAMSTLQALALFAASHMHRLTEEILCRLEDPATSHAMKLKVLETLFRLAPFASFQANAARAVHSLVEILKSGDESLVPATIDALAAVLQEGDESLLCFLSNVPEQYKSRLVREVNEFASQPGGSTVSDSESIEAPGGNMTLSMALGEHVETAADRPSDVLVHTGLVTSASSSALAHKHAKEVWEAGQATTEVDWSLWMRRLSVELLRDSPDATLRACASVAHAHQPLARDLFNAAFLSCWIRLSDGECSALVKVLKAALKHPMTPPDVLHALLNLAEFMDHHNRALPIDVPQMASFAMRCHAYAKALRYKEVEFSTAPAQCLDDLIAINHHLEHHEAAAGLLRLARGSPFSRRIGLGAAVPVHETWFERLGRWRDALESYESKLRAASEDERVDLTLGAMRCLASLGEYAKLTEIGYEMWDARPETRSSVAPLIAHALWAQGQWGEMERFVNVGDKVNVSVAILRAVAAIAKGPQHYHEVRGGGASDADPLQAQTRVEAARKLLANDLSTLLAESYTSAYHRIVLVQQLVELEEIAAVKSRGWDEDYEAHCLDGRWKARLQVCQRSVYVWQQILSARLLMRRPEEDLDTYIKFVNICRREERWGLGRATLARVGVDIEDPIASLRSGAASPRAVYSYVKLVWAGASDKPPAGDRLVAVKWLSQLIAEGFAGPGDLRLAVRTRLQLGKWTMFLEPDKGANVALRIVEEGQRLDPSCYKSNHVWALLNFHAFESGKNTSTVHLVEAIRGFFYAIALGRGALGPSSSKASTGSVMQDVLRLMTLWFEQASKFPVALNALKEGFASRRIPISTWLNVVPQLIARIQVLPWFRGAASADASAQASPPFLRELLVELGSSYPQALVYPLTVAARSVDPKVRGAGESILSELRQGQAVLLDQAALVARELIRVAILLPEEWYEALEDACKAWYPNLPTNEGDVRTTENVRLRLKALKGMNEILSDLNSRLHEQFAGTKHEGDFYRRFGKSLERAAALVREYEERRGYEKAGKNKNMQDAWVEYKRVYHEIGEKYLKELGSLELDDVSPRLLAQRNLELAVPGTFKVGDPLVTITEFSARIKVFATKQRPRCISMVGSDGNVYKYLLKGHEDLRQDERAMQLFGMVNALLSKTAVTSRRDLSIQQYIVIPLSNNVGLIGWLPHTDTIHSLVRRFRADRRVLLNLEQQLANKVSPAHDNGARAAVDPHGPGNQEGYERLTLIQKVEAFESALSRTDGTDLAQVMWHKSTSAEVWLDRRTAFTRSLATMSMVGYILGLGDRHPSNLMIDRHTGRVVHIDFGDCFEVAIFREKFPERVPFRLTRMLVNAMEVSGIEGNFRSACEAVMLVLRDNRDSVMAMLEAFVYDPLISWRLWAHNEASKQQIFTQTSALDVVVEEEPRRAHAHERLSDADNSDVDHAMPPSPSQRIIEGSLSVNGGTSLSRAVPIRLRRNTVLDEAEDATTNIAQSLQVNRDRRRFSIIDDQDMVLNKQAVKVIRRVRDKLAGLDFGDHEPLDVPEQVNKLIRQATATENLCTAFTGWCSWW